jgi:hypothetical protein
VRVPPGPLAVAGLIGLLNGSCTPDGERGRISREVAGPTLQLTDSVRLAEPESLLVGRLTQGFTVDTGGRYYVASPSAGMILRFAPDGAFERVYGRRGRGPGEFVNISPVVYVTDSLVLATDNMGRRVNAFHRDDGRPLASRQFTGYIGSLFGHEGRLWFGSFLRSEPVSVGSVEFERFFRDTAANPFALMYPRMVQRPLEFAEFRELDMAPDVRVLHWRDTTLVGYGFLNHLALVAGRDAVQEVVLLPRRLRRGVPRDSLDAHFRKSPVDFKRAVESISFLEGLWDGPGGMIVIVHMDTRANMTPDRMVASVEATAYVSLLRRDLTAACVDAEVPTDPESRPQVWVRQDTLYVLEQVVTETPTPRADLIVRSYRIVPDECTWVPLRRGRGPALAD